jgi:hypothetical protein
VSDPSGSSKLPILQNNPLGHDVRQALSSYLSVTGLVTARPGDEWTVRPLPGTGSRKDSQRLFTVNVSNMETLYAYFNPITGEEVGGRLHVWHELTQSLPRLEREFEIGELEEIEHKTADGHARAIYFLDLTELVMWLDDREIAEAAARLVAYLRSHGQVPGMQRRWHDSAFAAWLQEGG